MSLTPQQRSLAGRIGGLSCAAQHDGREMTEPARAAARNKIERDVIEQYGLDPVNPDPKRLQAGISAYYTRLQLASSKARSARAAGELTKRGPRSQ